MKICTWGLLAVAAIMLAHADQTDAANGFSAYKCVVKATYELSVGSFKSAVNSSRYLDHDFVVDRMTGRIIGDSISSTGYKTIEVLDIGSDQQSYKVLYFSAGDGHGNIGLLVIQEWEKGSSKSFALNHETLVSTGFCRRLT